MVFSTLLPFWHPKYPPEMVVITAVFMVWRAGAPPSPLWAPKWGKLVNFSEFIGFSPKTLKWGKIWFPGHFTPQTPKNHPKYHPETIDFTAVFMVWRAGAPPGPLLAPKWGKRVNFNEFNGF